MQVQPTNNMRLDWAGGACACRVRGSGRIGRCAVCCDASGSRRCVWPGGENISGSRGRSPRLALVTTGLPRFGRRAAGASGRVVGARVAGRERDRQAAGRRAAAPPCRAYPRPACSKRQVGARGEEGKVGRLRGDDGWAPLPRMETHGEMERPNRGAASAAGRAPAQRRGRAGSLHLTTCDDDARGRDPWQASSATCCAFSAVGTWWSLSCLVRAFSHGARSRSKSAAATCIVPPCD